MLAGCGRVLLRAFVVAPGGVRVVGGLLVVASFVVLGRVRVMGGGVGMMLGGFVVVSDILVTNHWGISATLPGTTPSGAHARG